MGSREPLFLQMKPNLVPHLKLVRNVIVVMSLLVLGINFFQNFIDFLSDVFNPFNKSIGLFSLSLFMGRVLSCCGDGKRYINLG